MSDAVARRVAGTEYGRAFSVARAERCEGSRPSPREMLSLSPSDGKVLVDGRRSRSESSERDLSSGGLRLVELGYGLGYSPNLQGNNQYPTAI